MTLRRRTVTRDSETNEDTVVFQDEGDPFWGGIEPLRVRETFEAQQVKAKATHRISLRRRTVNEADRIKVNKDNRVFEVESVRNIDDRNGVVELLVYEVKQNA